MTWTPTEDEVSLALLLVARGGSLEDVARHFGVSSRTVERRLPARQGYHEAIEARAVVARVHGTLTAYRNGCRCIPCREVHAERARGRRARKQPPVHGTISAYGNHGCRCDSCRAAGSESNRQQRLDRIARAQATDATGGGA